MTVLPPHLRVDAPEARCGRCGRGTWNVSMFGREDRMPQPDGFPCGGRFSHPDGLVVDDDLTGRTVYLAVTTIAIDGIEHTRTEGIYASKEGAEAALVELRESPMWQRQGLESWVNEDKIEP